MEEQFIKTQALEVVRDRDHGSSCAYSRYAGDL
jgi:hypothetical protein